MRKTHTKKRMWSLGVTAIMVAVEFFEVGLTTLSKAAMRKGMSNFVFIVYSNALAILFLLSSFTGSLIYIVNHLFCTNSSILTITKAFLRP